jgi:hypothetical protein
MAARLLVFVLVQIQNVGYFEVISCCSEIVLRTWYSSPTPYLFDLSEIGDYLARSFSARILMLQCVAAYVDSRVL